MTLVAPRRPRLAIAGGLLAALVATLSTTGVLRGVDQYAVDHWMPWLRARHHPLVTFGGLTIPSLDPPAVHSALELWVYPAAVLPSLVIVLAAVVRLPRRDAIVWCGLWCAGNVVEVVGKLVLDRPRLYHHGRHVSIFDTSLPSGHTIRAFILAGAAATAWRSGRFALVWAATTPFTLVVSGWHTPSDVAAGVFVAVTLAAWAPARDRRKVATA
ncbi:MAG: phosphatase PAP2 family protein [Gaiellaceae bacterium]